MGASHSTSTDSKPKKKNEYGLGEFRQQVSKNLRACVACTSTSSLDEAVRNREIGCAPGAVSPLAANYHKCGRRQSVTEVMSQCLLCSKSPRHRRHNKAQYDTNPPLHQPGYVQPIHVPSKDVGTDFYSRRHVFAKMISGPTPAMVLSAIKGVKINKNVPYVIVDYGCADGLHSRGVMSETIKMVREKCGDQLPILLIYEDRHDAEFKSVLTLVQGFQPGIASLVGEAPNVFALASGTSFYSVCLPHNYVDVGFSASAIHWLSKRPCTLKNALIHFDEEVSSDELAQFQHQAASDYETFLLCRASELKVHGRMMLCVMCNDSQLQEKYGWRGWTIRELWKTCWRSMVKQGHISEEEFENTTFNTYFRNQDELLAPFQPGVGGGAVLKAGLRVSSAPVPRFIPCPMSKKWRDMIDQETNDGVLSDGKRNMMAGKFAHGFVEAIKVFAYNTFYEGLSQERSESEKNEILTTFFNIVRDKIAEKPEYYSLDTVIIYLLVEKVDEHHWQNPNTVHC